MERSEEILRELEIISPALTKLGVANVMAVPPGYFDQLAGKIMSNLKGDEVRLEEEISNPYQAPAGYFDSLSASILKKVKQPESEVLAELKELSPLLSSISRQNVFTVPNGYFDHLKVKVPRQAKVVSFATGRKYLRYAVAAIITTLMAVSAFLLINKEETSPSALASQPVNINKAVDKLSEEEILSYLESNSSATDAVNILNTPEPAVDVDELIQQMPEEDIREFLNDKAEQKDNI